MSISYSVAETWGLIVNIRKDGLDQKQRSYIDLLLDRDILIKDVLHSHKSLINPHLKQNTSLSPKLPKKIKVLIPKELGSTGKRFCGFIKKMITNTVIDCHFQKFTQLLSNIKSNRFHLALLSISIDLPYIESISEFLVGDSNFSIINQKVKTPRNLTTLKGNKHFNAVYDFLNRKSYFISLTRPKRKIWGSSMDKYIPSLISAAYDPIENLAR